MSEDTRTRIEALVRADPTMTAAAIAAELGVTRQRVHQLLTALGYSLPRQEWRKRRPAKSE